MFGLQHLIAQAREQDLQRAGERAAQLREAHEASAAAALREAVTIRQAYPDDWLALRRLAELDSSEVPQPPLLVAETGGLLRAACSLRDGRTVADPFHPIVNIVELLTTRAEQLRPERQRRRPRLLRPVRTAR